MIADDEMAQAYTERDIATNLALRLHPLVAGPGLPECDECGASIHPKRQGEGARHCVPCTEKIELHERLRAGVRG